VKKSTAAVIVQALGAAVKRIEGAGPRRIVRIFLDGVLALYHRAALW
jgi:hypothetical protein